MSETLPSRPNPRPQVVASASCLRRLGGAAAVGPCLHFCKRLRRRAGGSRRPAFPALSRQLPAAEYSGGGSAYLPGCRLLAGPRARLHAVPGMVGAGLHAGPNIPEAYIARRTAIAFLRNATGPRLLIFWISTQHVNKRPSQRGEPPGLTDCAASVSRGRPAAHPFRHPEYRAVGKDEPPPLRGP